MGDGGRVRRDPTRPPSLVPGPLVCYNSPMAPDPHDLPAARLVRWLAVAALILGAVWLYFRYGVRIAPLGTHVPTP